MSDDKTTLVLNCEGGVLTKVTSPTPEAEVFENLNVVVVNTETETPPSIDTAFDMTPTILRIAEDEHRDATYAVVTIEEPDYELDIDFGDDAEGVGSDM